MTDIAQRPTRSSTRGTDQPTARLLTARQLSALREHLDHDREQTRILIDSITEDMGAITSARRDTAATTTGDDSDPEGPSMAFERSQSSSLLRQSMQHGEEISAALARMDEGTYGLCGTCHEPVGLGRLQARPQAALCIACAARVRG